MSCSVDKSELIWTRGIVLNIVLSLLVFLVVSDYRVTQSQCFKELLEHLVVFMIAVIELRLDLVVFKVDVSDS